MDSRLAAAPFVITPATRWRGDRGGPRCGQRQHGLIPQMAYFAGNGTPLSFLNVYSGWEIAVLSRRPGGPMVPRTA